MREHHGSGPRGEDARAGGPRDRNAAVRRQFGAASAAYVESPVHRSGADLEAMLRRADPAPDARVLDVGTGAGHTALAFAPHVAEVVAFDLTPAMLERVREAAASRGLANLRTQRGDAAALPFPAAAFDVVTCRLCAHHFAAPARAVAEMARVLRPGGVLLLEDSVSPEDPAQDTFLNAIELLRDPSHVRNLRVSEWRPLLAAAGLETTGVADFPARLDFDAWVARMRTPEPEARQIRRLMDGAPDEVRAAFRIEPGHHWTIPIALLEARRPA